MEDKITLNGMDMFDYSFEHQIAGHFGSKYNKELVCRVCPASRVVSYKVLDHGKLVIDTQDFKTACEYYENIRN